MQFNKIYKLTGKNIFMDAEIVNRHNKTHISNNELSLKPINDLLAEKFIIPSYQRGYRWSKRQVKDLLNDIVDFQKGSESKNKESFYCLQPIVVRNTNTNNEWEVIDGQQRLTTIYLILKYLEDVLKFYKKQPYSLRYETRKNSDSFLQSIDLSRKKENIDYFHICEAYETITEWFDERDGNLKIHFLTTLLNPEEDGKNVKVIWYEIKEPIDPIDVFTRLNIGKIPLTNAELVKALFLRSRNFENKEQNFLQQLKIAQEWDSIEKALQSEAFWYFLQNADSFSNRIEYILKLIADEKSDNTVVKDDPLKTFIIFNNSVFSKKDIDVDAEWLEIKKYFMTFDEWFNDRYLYHIIGYLINEGVPISDIRQSAEKKYTKQEFRADLKRKIFYKLFGKELVLDENIHNFINEKLNDWDYEKDSGKGKIRSTLLLFNISTLLQNKSSNLRFQFDSYKLQEWDIEHIRSVKSEMSRPDEQKRWLENVLEHLTGSRDIQQKTDDPNCKKIIELLDAKLFDRNGFDKIYEEILKHFKEVLDDDTDNSIGNLTLLDAHTNRSYKNAVFPIKRKRILSLDKTGTFVPLCTKNVFLKYYSQKCDNMMFWSEDDRADYFSTITETLTQFFLDNNGDMQ